ncbi:MAG: efflux RND transporter periplasmic adaptor subunit [Verrucomicrobiota bacterium]
MRSLHLAAPLGIPFLFLLSCGPEETEIPATIIRPVESTVVEKPKATIERLFSGLVSSAEGTDLAFEVSGRVTEVIAKEGVRYEKGDPLARLDKTELENQLSGAQAELTEAKQDLRRTQQLLETGNASKSQLESAIAREQSAQSSYRSTEKRVKDSVLTMPYPGVIGTVSIEPQMVINSGMTVMTIQGDGGMEFEIGIPADSISDFRVGMKGSIQLGSIPDRSFPAEVDAISPQVTQNTTYPVTLRFLKQYPDLREGMDGEAGLTLQNPTGMVILVPVESVAALPGDTRFVWVVEETNPGQGVVTRRPVEVGNLREDGLTEIRSGLTPGDRIVTRGVHRLEPSQEVLIPSSEES